jgi:purine nucleoside phosphorylase
MQIEYRLELAVPNMSTVSEIVVLRHVGFPVTQFTLNAKSHDVVSRDNLNHADVVSLKPFIVS